MRINAYFVVVVVLVVIIIVVDDDKKRQVSRVRLCSFPYISRQTMIEVSVEIGWL